MFNRLPVPENLPCRLTDAFYRIHQYLPKGNVKQRVKLDDALNQINTDDLYALQDFPLHNFSAYEGWAIDSNITQQVSSKNLGIEKDLYFWTQQLYHSINPYKLDLDRYIIKIPKFTRLPEGVDTIILEQDKRLDFSGKSSGVKIKKTIAPMQGVIQQGSVFKQGDLILAKNQKITPERLVALRRAGITELSIYRHPKILIVNMFPFDQAGEISEECLYLKDLLKTWGYGEVEIKPHKPARYDRAFNSHQEAGHPALDGSLTSAWDEYHQFFDEQIPEFDIILCWSPLNHYGSGLGLSKLANFYQGNGDGPVTTCCVPASEFRIFQSNDRSPRLTQVVSRYDERGQLREMRTEITEDRTTIISLPGNMQDVALLMHVFVKYILNKHDPDFFENLYLQGRIDQQLEPDPKYRTLLWGRYQFEADGQYSLQIIPQQPFQIDGFAAANCIIIVPFAEPPIQSGESVYFIKIDQV